MPIFGIVPLSLEDFKACIRAPEKDSGCVRGVLFFKKKEGRRADVRQKDVPRQNNLGKKYKSEIRIYKLILLK